MHGIATGIPYYTFPEIELGPLTLRTFGLFVGLGMVIGTIVAARRNERFGIERGETERVAFILILAGLVGARLLWVLTHLDEIDNPVDVIAVWEGGLQFTGGFVTAILLAPLLTRRWPKTERWALLDGAVLGLAVGQAIGRIGCYAVGEHLGGPTEFFLGVNYRGGETREGPLTIGETIHNTALYEILWLIPLIGALLWLDRRGTRPGVMSGVFVIGYGVMRFGTDFLRAFDETLAGLTGAQYMCLLLIPFGVWLLYDSRDRSVAGETGGPAPA